MRAALLPTPGDPFILAYWLRNYETWRNEVDELIVYVNGQTDPEMVEYDRRIIEEHGGRMMYSPDAVGHDGALLAMMRETSAEYVVWCEDDAYVRKPIMVGVSFVAIEDGKTDIVGTPRHEDYAGQYVEFEPYQPGALIELRRGLWPTFLFARRADLLATDLWWLDHTWMLGDTITDWGVVTPEACKYVGISETFVHLDAFFGMTFQLRARGLRTKLIHHVRLFDPRAAEDWLAEDPPWFHITNISTLSSALAGVDPATLPDMDSHGGLWTRRLAWWRHVAGLSDRPDAGARVEVLTRFAARAGIDPFVVAQWQARFAAWEPVAVMA
jgi:hypothetical protein